MHALSEDQPSDQLDADLAGLIEAEEEEHGKSLHPAVIATAEDVWAICKSAPAIFDDTEAWGQACLRIYCTMRGHPLGGKVFDYFSRQSPKYREGEPERFYAACGKYTRLKNPMGALRQLASEMVAAGSACSVSPVAAAVSEGSFADCFAPGSEGLARLNGRLRVGRCKPEPPQTPPVRSKPPLTKPLPGLDDLIVDARFKVGGRWVQGEEVARWPYRNAAGEVVLWVVRYSLPNGEKEYRQFTRRKSGWAAAGLEKGCPLYRLPELLQANAADTWVVLCEGEKCADVASSLGFVGTTSCGGAQSPSKTDWSPLSGRHVVILPDADKPGEGYALKVQRLLAELAVLPASVRVVHLPGLPVAGDLADYVEGRLCN